MLAREHVDGPADSVAGDAPAYRKDLGCEGVNILSDGLILDRWSQGCNFTQSNHPPLPRPGMLIADSLIGYHFF